MASKPMWQLLDFCASNGKQTQLGKGGGTMGGKLSVKGIMSAQAKEKTYRLGDGNGLYLVVYKNKKEKDKNPPKKSWQFRYFLNKEEKAGIIGEFPDVGLAEARIWRDEARHLVRRGIDPFTRESIKDAEKIPQTEEKRLFSDMAEEWYKKESVGWTSEEHAATVRRSLDEDILPFLGAYGMREIKSPLINAVVQNIIDRGANVVAAKVARRIKAIFIFADLKYDLEGKNPAANAHLLIPTPPVEHRERLSRQSLPQFLWELGNNKRIHPIVRDAFLFTILTGARTIEVRKATWKEIDFVEKMWRKPAANVKLREIHSVPLSQQAMELLKRQRRGSDDQFIFPGIKNPEKMLSENTLLYVLQKRMPEFQTAGGKKATVHGFRRVFSTAANCNYRDKDFIEMILDHRPRGADAVQGIYDDNLYLEERERIMQEWADYLDEQRSLYTRQPSQSTS